MAKRNSKKKAIPGAGRSRSKADGGAGSQPPRSSASSANRGKLRRPKPRRGRGRAVLVALVAVAIVVGVAVVAFSGSKTSGADVTEPTRFDLPALHGNHRVRLADFRGKPLVVNFFASWCSSCDAELPGFAKVSKELRGKVQFVGVNSLETGDRDTMPDRHHITWWPLAEDVGGAQSSGLHDALGGGNGMPITAFYDASGKLLGVQRTELPEPDLRQAIKQLYGIST